VALHRWPDTDAVLASSDAMALGAIAALRGRGVDVPGDVAVAGFDDIPFAALSTPALTTATHPVDRIAAGAVTALLTGRGVPLATRYASELIRRDSA
jgi:DNA-binding LacI/PurR family transcriptional regulator